MMEELLAKGANPNLELTENNETSLFIGKHIRLNSQLIIIILIFYLIACEKGFKDAVKLLLKSDYKTISNCKNRQDWTPIFVG